MAIILAMACDTSLIRGVFCTRAGQCRCADSADVWSARGGEPDAAYPYDLSQLHQDQRDRERPVRGEIDPNRSYH